MNKPPGSPYQNIIIRNYDVLICFGDHTACAGPLFDSGSLSLSLSDNLHKVFSLVL